MINIVVTAANIDIPSSSDFIVDVTVSVSVVYTFIIGECQFMFKYSSTVDVVNAAAITVVSSTHSITNDVIVSSTV